MAGIGAETLGDLAGKFAGRRKHQNACAPCPAFLRIFQHEVERGQRESGRFACTGLRDAQKVFVFQQQRNGLCLNRSRRFVAFFRNCPHQQRVQAEV